MSAAVWSLPLWGTGGGQTIIPINLLYLQYEERTWKMAYGYSQIYHYRCCADLHIWRRAREVDNIRWRFIGSNSNPFM